MNKIPAYEISKKTKIKKEPQKNQIIILITEENLKHLDKCLKDPAFISSISKLIFNKNPNHFSIKVGVTKITKVE